jgi:hypothetical protein
MSDHSFTGRVHLSRCLIDLVDEEWKKTTIDHSSDPFPFPEVDEVNGRQRASTQKGLSILTKQGRRGGRGCPDVARSGAGAGFVIGSKVPLSLQEALCILVIAKEFWVDVERVENVNEGYMLSSIFHFVPQILDTLTADIAPFIS